MASEKIKFWPLRGTKAAVMSQPIYDGKVYFTTDTNEIYLDIGNTRHCMGGGSSGIIYAKGTDSTIIQIAENSSTYQISFQALENPEVLPLKDSLVLNSDGRFFRVIEVGDEFFTANLLAVSGSGGSGGGGGSYSIIFINDIDGSTTKYFVSDTTEATISFSCSSSIELNNRIESITYDFGNGDIEIDNNPHALGETITFDFTKYLSKMSLARANSLVVTVKDAYLTEKSITYYLNILELTLSSNFEAIYKVDKGNDLRYYCTPRGGASLTRRELEIKLYSEDNLFAPLVEITQPIQSSGVEQTKLISTEELSHGTYVMTAQLVGSLTTNNSTIEMQSNLLSYHIIVFDEENNSPLFTAVNPNTTVEQYSTISIPYMLVYNNITGTSEIIRKVGESEATLSINNNEINYWTLTFDSVGTYDLELRYNDAVYIQFPTITVTQYQGNAPVLDESLDSLKLNLKINNRSNNEITRAEWNSGIYTGVLDNFKWGNINGWTRDANGVECLKLTAGAKLEITNYFPFAIDAGTTGKTIELDFMVSGVTDYSKPLISCLSYAQNGDIFNGLRVTGQESTLNSNNIHTANAVIIEGESESQQEYNTRVQALTSRFTEDERMHVSYVIEKKTTSSVKPLAYTYLNGVVSGITEYDNSDFFVDNNTSPSKIIVDSTYGDVYLYNIRVYDAALDNRIILTNYLATLSSLSDRITQGEWNAIIDDNGNISLDLIEQESYNLKIPYVLLTGGHAGTKKAVYQNSTDGFHLPYAKKDYRLMSMEYHDPNDSSKNFTEKLHFVDNTGNETDDINAVDTSYTAKAGVLVYGQGTSSMEYPVKNLRIKLLNSKFQVYKDGYPVNLLCFKADYMESSSSHNTGTGNLVYNLYNNLNYKTPAQTFYENLSDPDYNYKYVTAIRGYPVIIFYRENEEQNFSFVGRYNLNLDKATQEPFGFFSYDDGEGHTFGLDENGKETIHCVEWLNNASALCNFLGNPSTMDEVFDAGWADSFESRYPEDDDLSEVPAFKNFIKWVNSTNSATATNEEIEPIAYSNIIYTTDSAEYRLAKFKNEVWEHMNREFTLFYYVLTHILLMIDSRAKNMMMATWDDQHWYPIFYDMDTMLGLNNYGYNKYNYDIEDTVGGIYNGESSVLWNNIRACFPDEIADMYDLMRSNGLNYSNLIKIYNDDQANAWNEALSNADARYKYIRPYTTGYYNGLTGEPVWVDPYNKSYLYAAQGRRSFHRQWWLSNRLNYFDGKYTTDSFIRDNVNLRIYSLANATDPQVIASAAAVPPDASFALTPFKNGYVAVAYGGQNGYVTPPVYTLANNTTMVYPAEGDVPNDTETYICGASQLKDIGDLSTKYMGNFDLSQITSCKLTKLILGNHNPNYYNPNMTIASIGTAAPYLEEIDITNTQLTNLDLFNCLRVKKILAAGSKLTSITLPDYGIVEELRLPSSIGTLNLNNQLSLTDFTIGTLEINNSEEIYHDAEIYNLNTLTVKNTPVNSYKLVMKSPNLQRYLLTDVNWYISEDDMINENKLSVLEKLMPLETIDNTPRNLALSGTVTIGIDNCVIDAYEIYDKYHTIYPNLTIQYDTENHPTMQLANVINISFLSYSGSLQTYAVLPQSASDPRRTTAIYTNIMNEVEEPAVPSTISKTFTFTGQWQRNGNELLTREEIINLLPLLEENSEFVPQFVEAVREYRVVFYNDEAGTQAETENIMNIPYGSNIKMPVILPYKDDSSLPLEQVYKLKGFSASKNSSNIIDATTINISGSSAKDWEFYPVYNLQSVYDESTSLDYFDFGELVTYDEQETNIPDNAKNATYNKTGYIINIKEGFKLRGKVTLPNYYENYPVIGLGLTFTRCYSSSLGSEITHIFWEKATADKPHNLRELESYSNSPAGTKMNLQFIQIPEGTRIIGRRFFMSLESLKTLTPAEDNPMENSIILPSTIVVINESAFNDAFAGNSQLNEISVPGATAVISRYAFANKNCSVGTFNIGSSTASSQLIQVDQRSLIDNTGSISGAVYSHNSGLTSNMNFYYSTQEQYTNFEMIESYFNGIETKSYKAPTNG